MHVEWSYNDAVFSVHCLPSKSDLNRLFTFYERVYNWNAMNVLTARKAYDRNQIAKQVKKKHIREEKERESQRCLTMSVCFFSVSDSVFIRIRLGWLYEAQTRFLLNCIVGIERDRLIEQIKWIFCSVILWLIYFYGSEMLRMDSPFILFGSKPVSSKLKFKLRFKQIDKYSLPFAFTFDPITKVGRSIKQE